VVRRTNMYVPARLDRHWTMLYWIV
jgi:hypothetical protein